MSANFLSLPSAIFTHIWDYCGVNEIITLASTCRRLHTEIENSMLEVHARCESYLKASHVVPIFFADHCHSVFLKFGDLHGHAKVVVFSRKRYQNGPFDTVVWEGTNFRYISFRNDPSREYLVRDVLRLEKFDLYSDVEGRFEPRYQVELRKQFMTSAVTPSMKGALSVCLNVRAYPWHPIYMCTPQHRDEMNQFFMKLFILGYSSLSEESSPIRKFFESGEKRTPINDTSCCLIPQIINLFEQTLEQTEPIDCVKRTLSEEEIERYLWHPKQGFTSSLPHLCLKPEFAWKASTRGHFDQENDNSCNDELVFIARIPLALDTTSITLTTYAWTDSSSLQFVIFFQKRRGGMDKSENPIDGKVFTIGGPHYKCNRKSFTVNVGHGACYLYFVPGKATRMEMTRLDVSLRFVDDPRTNLSYWMEVLLGRRWNELSSVYHRYLPIILLRAGALALLGPDQEQNTELKNAFDKKFLDSTPQGLACIVDVCNALLQDERMD